MKQDGKRTSKWQILFASGSRDPSLRSHAVRSADEIVWEADQHGLRGAWTFELVADDKKVLLRGTVATPETKLTRTVTMAAHTKLRTAFRAVGGSLIGEHTGEPHQWAIDGVVSSLGQTRPAQ